MPRNKFFPGQIDVEENERISRPSADVKNSELVPINDQAVLDVLAERVRQTAKWGEQNHDLATWHVILSEEVGEFAECILHLKFGGKAAVEIRDECVQVCAVALQIIQYMDRTGVTALVESMKSFKVIPQKPSELP